MLTNNVGLLGPRPPREGCVFHLLTRAFDSNAGYCFVEFANPEAATKALNLNGSPVPNSTRAFKLNWASGGGLVDRR